MSLTLANIQAMQKKPPGQATEDGLRRYAEAAPTLVMRELATAAVWRGLTLGALARRCSSKATIDSSNVRRYFEGKRPRAETIEMLRSAIGLTKTHVNLIRYFESAAPLSARERHQMSNSLRVWLANNEARFEDSAAREALETLEQLDDDRQTHALAAFELQLQRIKARMIQFNEQDDDYYPRVALEAFAAELRRFTSFDLLNRIRERNAGESILWHLWIQLAPPTGAFTEREAESIIYVASGLLRARGIDTQPMEYHLNRQRAAHMRADLAVQRLTEEE